MHGRDPKAGGGRNTGPLGGLCDAGILGPVVYRVLCAGSEAGVGGDALRPGSVAVSTPRGWFSGPRRVTIAAKGGKGDGPICNRSCDT